MFFYRRYIVAVAVLAAACDASPMTPTPDTPAAASRVAAAQPEVHEELWDLTGVLWGFECEGAESELIRLDGAVRHRLFMLEDGAGGFHASMQARSVGLRGTGLVSGEEFRVREISVSAWNDNGMGRGSSFMERVDLVGRDSGRGFRYVVMAHFRINANGELTVEADSESWTCVI